jgi:hypothetical protein
MLVEIHTYMHTYISTYLTKYTRTHKAMYILARPSYALRAYYRPRCPGLWVHRYLGCVPYPTLEEVEVLRLIAVSILGDKSDRATYIETLAIQASMSAYAILCLYRLTYVQVRIYTLHDVIVPLARIMEPEM